MNGVYGTFNSTPILTTPTLIASPSLDRTSLTITPHSVRGYTVNFKQSYASLEGLFIPTNHPRIYLKKSIHGDAVQKAVYSLASVADSVMSVIEGFADGGGAGRDENGRLMRKRLISNILAVPVSTVSAQILGPSKDRWSLVFTPGTAGNITLSVFTPVVSLSGLILVSNTNAIMLDYPTHGNIVQKAWYAITSASSFNMGILETIAADG